VILARAASFLRERLLLRIPPGGRAALEAAAYGLVGGLVAVAFQAAINALYRSTLPRFAGWGTGAFLASSFALVVGTALLSGLLLRFAAPEAAGSGIPQLKLAFWKDFGFVPLRLLLVKFVAGALAVGGGSSLGREGPTVQLAGGAASNAAALLGKAKTGRRGAAAAGAAAGLAAAFNTPLAAVAFVLEEMLGDLHNRLIGAVAVAAVVGAFVVHALVGRLPAFPLPETGAPALREQWLSPLVALLAGLLGVLFQKGALGLRRSFRDAPRPAAVPAWARPALGAAGAWAVGAGVFLACGRLGVFGLGYDDLALGLGGGLAGTAVFLLLLGKLAATVLCYGSGGCGGIFAPSLFLGALTGCAVAEACRWCGAPLSPGGTLMLSVVGMSACIGAVVRAPFTSILIVFEMTRQFSLVPALLVGSVVSQAASRLLLPRNFYDQILADDGHALDLAKVVPPRDFREWQARPVSAIANFRPAFAPDPGLPPAEFAAALRAAPHARLVRLHADGPRLLVRQETLDALAAGRPAPLHPLPACTREATVGEAQRLLVASEHGFLAVLDGPDGNVVGILTLHDLLRAQQNDADRGENG